MKFATTERAVVMLTVQAPLPAQAPVQPANFEPRAALAVSVTDVPLLYGSAQSLPQLMPAGDDVTVPDPVPALVTVSGRVTTAEGSGIRNVRVSLTDQTGVVRTTLTGSFGHYRFDDIEAGQTVVISVAAKRYVFASPTRIVTVQEELADIDFTAEP